VANLGKFFCELVTAADRRGRPSPPRFRREKASCCRIKNRGNSVAFSLPQDSQVELMFGAADFAERGASVSTASGCRMNRRRRSRGAPPRTRASASFDADFAIKRRPAP
jgi:hypothetical protein